MKTLCVTGHRPNGLPFPINDATLVKEFNDRLKEYIQFAIDNGFTNFIAGGAQGVDTYFALCVLELKEQYKNITLEIAVPCKEQAEGWNSRDKATYFNILKKADKVSLLSDKYTVTCMQERNIYMVDNSDAVLCCWNKIKHGGTYNTLRYAQKCNKPLLYFPLDSDGFLQNSIITFFDKIV